MKLYFRHFTEALIIKQLHCPFNTEIQP